MTRAKTETERALEAENERVWHDLEYTEIKRAEAERERDELKQACINEGHRAQREWERAERLAAALAAERERCARAICEYCARGWALSISGDLHFANESPLSQTALCRAAAIRREGAVRA